MTGKFDSVVTMSGFYMELELTWRMTGLLLWILYIGRTLFTTLRYHKISRPKL